VERRTPPADDLTVDCAACGHLNREGAAFCGSCGGRLDPAVACRSCGETNPQGQRFCDACGGALTPPALATERRRVTILKADAVGSTPLGERVDEEVLYRLMQACVGRMTAAVERHGGSVTQFTGDGVFAVFGAPVAYEDSARRGVLAGLDMQQALVALADEQARQARPTCAFRVGIHTGPVVVGQITSDDRDYTALGDTANLAARMEGLADPGTVFLTEETYRQVRDYVECEPVGTFTVKGRSAAVTAYRAVRPTAVRSRLEAETARGLTTFVGRDEELAVLLGHLDKAGRGAAQTVLIAGEAGVGKSRLLLELRSRAETRSVRWVEGQCSTGSENVPFLPFIDMVKRAFGVDEADAPDEVAAKLDAGTAGWGAEAAPYLRHLLSIDPGNEQVAAADPAERRAGVVRALCSLLAHLADEQAVVVIVEDLHWADRPSVEALEALVGELADSRVLLLLTSRPGGVPSLASRHDVNRLALASLPRASSVVLAQQVLDGMPLAEGVQQLVAAKAEGNPFFIEELLRSLVDRELLRAIDGVWTLAGEVADLDLPGTVQEVVLSRIDRLPAEAREALQLASVIGREFTVRLLARIAADPRLDSSLEQLRTLELIYPRSRFPELSFLFKHALIHEVAYSTLLRERRRELHAVVAAAVEDMYADRIAEHVEMLARHHLEAGALDAAYEYALRAGDKASESYATAEAVRWYQTATEVGSQLDIDRAWEAAARHVWSRFVVGDLEGLDEMLGPLAARAEAEGRTDITAMARAWAGLRLVFFHDFAAAEGVLRPAYELAKASGGDRSKALAGQALLELLMSVDELEEAHAVYREVEPLMDEVTDALVRAGWSLFGALLPNWGGQPERALVHLDRFSDLPSCAVGYLRPTNRWLQAIARGTLGEHQEAIDLLLEGLAVAEAAGEVYMRMRILNTLGWAHAEVECHEQALRWNELSIELARSVPMPDFEVEGNGLTNSGDNLLAVGHVDEAEERYRTVEAVYRNPSPPDVFMLWRYSQHALHGLAQVGLARGDLGMAGRYGRELLERATITNSTKYVAKARLDLGLTAAAGGDRRAAEDHLRVAYDLAERLRNPPLRWRVREALARVHVDDADALLREAADIVESMAGGLRNEEMRRTLLSSPAVAGLPLRQTT
jgi:class 3 adenylate cyclase